VNPYAGALRENGKSKRDWDASYIQSFRTSKTGDPVRFELTNGVMAEGTIKIVRNSQDGQVSYVSGELTAPETGKFFFLTPPAGGKAGNAVGVVEFPESKTAYRVEPTGNGGAPELWQRRLDEVVCLEMEPADPALVAADIKAAADKANLTPVRPDKVPDFIPSYNANIVSLQSYPGSPAVLLLDFAGGYTDSWGGVTYSRAPVDNDTIRDIWKRVAEDYMPFNINVTTDIKVFQAAPAASKQRCCFGPNPVTDVGVAYIGSWNWGSDTVCWSGYYVGKAAAEVGAHEPGHTLGLAHQGQEIPNSSGGTDHNEYYAGQGGGETGWCPIMGAGYYQPVTTFAKGEYQYANQQQDELATIIGNNNVHYRTDDTGSTLATSRYLDVNADNTVTAEGVIEQTGDTDAFQFTTTGGSVTLTAHPVAENDWADLGLMAVIANSSEGVIATNNVQTSTAATITTTLAAGTYTFKVTGVGKGSGVTDGFTSYSSLGYYYITGKIAGGRQPTRLSVVEHAATSTVVGTITATNPNSSPLVYTIASGNTGGTFSVDSNGVVTVASNALLDYYALAANTGAYGARFELFVNIANTSNPGYNETNRRVLIEVQKFFAPVPTSVTAVVDSGLRLNLSWTGSADATSYNVKRSTTHNGPYATIGTAYSTNFSDNGLSQGTTYYYVVSAVNANGESANSAEASGRAQALAGFGFEAPPVGGGYSYNTAGSVWTFSGAAGSGSGILGNGSGFGNPNAPEGSQAGFVQGLGTITQTLPGLVPGTTYVVSYAAAQRSGSAQNGGESWNVTIDGTTIQANNPGSTNYTSYSTTFVASAAMQTLAFVGTDLATGDNTVFIDNVQVSMVAPTIPNFSFEAPSLGTGGGSYQYNPTGGSWTFSAQSGNSGSGVAGNGSAFGNPDAPMGTQVAFVQTHGIVKRTLTGFTPGQTYTVTYAAAQRPGNSQSWDVKIDNNVIQSNSPGGGAFATYTATFTATATSHTLSFVGTDLAGGDNTVFIDNVSIISPPQFNAPVPTLTNPSNNATFLTSATINLTANVTANGNLINSVQFYADSVNLLGTAASPPYTYAWSGGGAGRHDVFARVQFNNGSHADTQIARIAIVNSNQNLSFETPSVSGYQYSPAGGSWSFNGSGIAANGGGFNNPNAPSGTQAAFLQSYGKFSQVLASFIPGRIYTITYVAAQRTAVSNGGESWDVMIDDKVIASNTPGSSSYANYSATFTATSAIHTLAFVGTDLAGLDNTVFIDKLKIASPVPLALGSASSAPTLRQANPGSVNFTVTNPDLAAAANVELTLTFPAGASPDSVTLPGWVVEAKGNGAWSLRLASLGAGASGVATVTWASLPAVASIPIATTLHSDTTALTSSQTTLTLLPSYAAWSAGLSDPAQGSDPDGDGVSNVLEYALGGDPASSSLTLPGGPPLLPQISVVAGNLDFSFPERTDAADRGLSYIVETSTDLVSWSATLPAGNGSSAAAFDPAIDGFTMQHWTWPLDSSSPGYFVRLRVELNESP
jgi:hypothetical protein